MSTNAEQRLQEQLDRAFITIAEQNRTIEQMRGVQSSYIKLTQEQNRTILDMEAREKMHIEMLKTCYDASVYLEPVRGDDFERLEKMATQSANDTEEHTARFVAEYVQTNWKPSARLNDVPYAYFLPTIPKE